MMVPSKISKPKSGKLPYPPTPTPTTRHLIEMQTLRPQPHLLGQTPHFITMIHVREALFQSWG